MDLIPAKNIISGYAADSGWFGCNYNMNIYRGCSHGCIYCDSRSACYQIEDFDRVRAKANALAVIERNLRSKQKKGIIGTGAMSDPYNPKEAKYALTRGALALIDRYHFGVVPLTKSALVTRDMDLYLKIAEHSPVCVMMTITTCDDALSKKVEPNVSPSSERFAALKAFSDAGIRTGIAMMPILPFLEDNRENLSGIVARAKEAGVRFIAPCPGMTLREGQREYYYAALEREFPGLKEKYQARYGHDYSCMIPDFQALRYYFGAQCKKAGIVTDMRDIVKCITKGYVREQISFV
ncbi:MAG: radical SAM protein [Eubacteriales bacterium]